MFRSGMNVYVKSDYRRGWVYKVTDKGWLVVVLDGDDRASWFRSDEVVHQAWLEAEVI